MPNSQSHLFSLAHLLETAEARHSTAPPPASTPGAQDSGLIDFMEIQRKAREERAHAAATPTPLPVTLPGADVTAGRPPMSSLSAHELVLDSRRRRKMLIVIGAAAGSIGVALAATVFALTGSDPPPAPARAAAMETPVAIAPPVAPPPPAPPVVAPPAPEPAAAAPEATAASARVKKKGKTHKHAKSTRGPKLMKVSSSGTIAP